MAANLFFSRRARKHTRLGRIRRGFVADHCRPPIITSQNTIACRADENVQRVAVIGELLGKLRVLSVAPVMLRCAVEVDEEAAEEGGKERGETVEKCRIR